MSTLLALQAERLWKRYLEQDDSPVTDFFGGQLQNNVTCHVCKHRFTSYEFFKVGLAAQHPHTFANQSVVIRVQPWAM